MSTSYTLQLTPTVRNLGTEGSLDTAVVGGLSIQRTGYIETVDSSNNRVVHEMLDGASFSDAPQALTDLSNGAGGNFIV